MKRLIYFLLILSVFLLPINSFSTVMFQDDFNSWTTGVTFVDGTSLTAPWETSALTGVTLPSTCNGVARPYIGGGGINATGGYGGSKGLEYPRCSSVSNGYYGQPSLMLENIGHYSELYFRFYVKFDSGLDKSISAGFKAPIDRILITNGSDVETMYPSMHGSGKLSASMMSLYTDSGYFSYTASWAPLASHTLLYDDHAWHAVELHIKLHPTTGRVRCWVDGNLQYDYNNVQTSPASGWYFQKLNFGMGNVSDETWDNTTWKSMWLDNLVVADTYVGPLSASDTTAPTVSITTSSGQTITSDGLVVTGTSSDDTGVSSCKWRVGSAPDTGNGTTCTGTTSFSCGTSGYSAGSNTLYIGCSDASGNWGSSNIVVNYSASSTISCGTVLFGVH